MALVTSHRLGDPSCEVDSCVSACLPWHCSAGLLLGGCDDVEGGGVGASVGLPVGIRRAAATDPADIGAGNVHWVGNPRW